MNQEHRSKGRGTVSRSQRGGGKTPYNLSHPPLASTTGIYRNDRFNHFICALMGKRVRLQVKNGGFYDGILTTISPNCEFVLSKVNLVEADPSRKPNWNWVPTKDDLWERIVFKYKDIVSITCPKVDLEETLKGESFLTDTKISHCVNGEIKEKELEPWKPDESITEVSMIGTKSDKSNGWEADKMFKVNEEVYGVKSNFDSSMSSYTTEIKKTNDEEYYAKLKQAERMAKEIEQDQYHNNQADSGKSEEELYSAVVRQNTAGGKYVPPHARGRPTGPGIERKEKGVNNDSRKTPSPHSNSPVSSRKLNGEDAKHKPMDTEQTSKAEIREQSPKGEVKVSQDVRSEIPDKEKLKEIFSSKPIHVKMEERAMKSKKKLASTADLKTFHHEFNLSTGSETQNKTKIQMPETQDIRKLEELEKLQNKEMVAPVSVPVTTVHSPSSSSSPPINHEIKAPLHNSNKPVVTESGQTSPVIKSTLNPNAKEFKLNPNAKSFVPKPSSPSQSQGIPTPTQAPTTVTQPSPNIVQRASFHRPRPRMYQPRSEYAEYPSTSPMTAAVAAGTPIMAPMVFQSFVPNQGMVAPGIPIQGPYLYPGPQRFISPAPVSYNMAISATPSGMPSNQGTMVTAGSFQPGTGTFPEGAPMPVYVTQSGNMAAPQHLLPGQPQTYQQHVIAATTPTGPPPPPPHQSPQPHQQPIFFQQPGAPQPPPNQQPHILQPGPVAMGQPVPQPGPPTVLVMPQTPPNIAAQSSYIR